MSVDIGINAVRPEDKIEAQHATFVLTEEAYHKNAPRFKEAIKHNNLSWVGDFNSNGTWKNDDVRVSSVSAFNMRIIVVVSPKRELFESLCSDVVRVFGATLALETSIDELFDTTEDVALDYTPYIKASWEEIKGRLKGLIELFGGHSENETISLVISDFIDDMTDIIEKDPKEW